MVNGSCVNLKHRFNLAPHAKGGTGFIKAKRASAGFFVSLRMAQSVMLSVSETSRGNGSGFKCGLTLVLYVKGGTGFIKAKRASAGFFVSLRMTLPVMLSVSETSRGNGSGFKHRLTLVPLSKGNGQ